MELYTDFHAAPDYRLDLLSYAFAFDLTPLRTDYCMDHQLMSGVLVNLKLFHVRIV